MTGAAPIELTVNGSDVTLDVHPDTPLLSVLRGPLGLTGPRFGCGLGMCGACFVIMDGQVVPSCDTPVWSAAGRTIVTVEGLAPGDELHPVQQALLDEQAAQCGYCLNGMIIATKALLLRSPRPSQDEVMEALRHHLCRCGAHVEIMRAALRAAGHVPEVQA